MKLILTFGLSALLCGSVWAQGDPPADPPKDGEPGTEEPPEEPPPISATTWAKTWEEARSIAQKQNGYAMLWLTKDKTEKGEDAIHTGRLMGICFNNPSFYRRLNEAFGCFKGTREEIQITTAAKILTEGNAEPGEPAIFFVDPEDGTIVDELHGPVNFMEVDELLTAVENGYSRKGCEVKLEDKSAAADEKLQLAYASALLRARNTKEARVHFELSRKSQDKKISMMGFIGTAWCDLREKKYAEAIKKAQEAYEEMPVDAPPRGTVLYIQMWAYYEQKEIDEAAKVAALLQERYRRTTFGWRLEDDMLDIGYDFIRKEKIQPPPPQNPDGQK